MNSHEVVYQLRVTIRDIEPPIWRNLHVSAASSLAELHRVLQAAFGWWDYHLHEFEIGGKRYGIDDGEGWEDPPLDERRATLGGLVNEGEVFVYQYDFGDGWDHEIEVLRALPAEQAAAYPVCLDGARARPPEDCGGPGGYADLLEAIADPGHEEHESMLTWAGSFDPEHFDPQEMALNLRFGPVFAASPAPAGDPVLEAALARLRERDPKVALVAAAALGGIIDGRSVETMSQDGLQRFLWDELPGRWSGTAGDRRFVVESLADLLDLLDLPRYAQICRSDATAAVLQAYETGEGSGVSAGSDAGASSGIRPPDLPGLTWGLFRGERESAAYSQLAEMLELAVASGDLKPGTRGWKQRQIDLVSTRLDLPQADLGGVTLRQTIQAERMERWVNSRPGSTRRRILAGILDRLQSPPEPPASQDFFPKLIWLLEQLDEGIPLTQSGNLGQKFVQSNAARFGWTFRNLPRSEDDLFDLHILRRFAQGARLARRQGRKLVLTKRGREVLADREALWRTAAGRLISGQPFDVFVGELALALLLDNPQVPRRDVIGQIGQAAAEVGFRNQSTGGPPNEHDVRWALADTMRLCSVLDLLALGGHWNDDSYGLNDTGRTLAAEALRLRAGSPRSKPF